MDQIDEEKFGRFNLCPSINMELFSMYTLYKIEKFYGYKVIENIARITNKLNALWSYSPTRHYS
ncbi:MAG: hypothetical protein ACSLE0_06285 [Chitinophagaceae bacterium]